VVPDSGLSQSWAARQEALLDLARRQLFFVGGAPRSGTTWLQFLLDSHPEISCRGSGLFVQHLAAPLETMMAERRKAVCPVIDPAIPARPACRRKRSGGDAISRQSIGLLTPVSRW
jgi:hypothetical protein